jgi:hypothetical protein
MDVALFDFPIAVIVVVPQLLPSANPAELTVATSESLDCQFTCAVKS